MRLQRLPLPVGSLHPIRRSARPAVLGAHGRPAAAAMLGMVAAAAGAILGTAPPTVSVGLDAGGYRIENVVLSPHGGGVYAGPKGAVIIPDGGDGRRASGSTRMHGQRTVGSCQVSLDRLSERCTFQVGAQTVVAFDKLQHGGWDRRYGDGQVIRIELEGGRPLPVPIPLGR